MKITKEEYIFVRKILEGRGKCVRSVTRELLPCSECIISNHVSTRPRGKLPWACTYASALEEAVLIFQEIGKEDVLLEVFL